MPGHKAQGASGSLTPVGWSSRERRSLDRGLGFCIPAPKELGLLWGWAPHPLEDERWGAGGGRVDPRRDRLPSPGSRKQSPAPRTCYWKSEGWAAPPVPTSSSPAPPPAARAFMGTQAWTVSLKSFTASALA